MKNLPTTQQTPSDSPERLVNAGLLEKHVPTPDLLMIPVALRRVSFGASGRFMEMQRALFELHTRRAAICIL